MGSSSGLVPHGFPENKGSSWGVVCGDAKLWGVRVGVSGRSSGGFPIQWDPSVLCGVLVSVVGGLPRQTSPIPLWVACAVSTVVGSLVVWLFRIGCVLLGGLAQPTSRGTPSPGCGSVWFVCSTIVCGIVLVIYVGVVCSDVSSR